MGITNYAGSEGYDWWSRCPGCAGPDSDGGIGKGGVFTTTASTRISDIPDGTSSTVAVSEVNGTGFVAGPFNASGGGRVRTSGEAVTRMAFMGATFTVDLSHGRPNPMPGTYTHPDGSSPSNWFGAGQAIGGPLLYAPIYLTAWGINNEWPAASSLHVGGAHSLVADGSVRFMSQNINWTVWNNLNSRNANDMVGEF